MILFASKGFDRVCKGCSQGTDTEDDEGDEQEAAATGCEDPPAKFGFVREVLEPFACAPPGDGKCDEDREADELEEVAGEQEDELGDGSADDLANANLFCALVGDIDDQAEETEAADEDGKAGGPAEEAGDVLFRGIEFRDGVIDELVLVVVVGIDG